MFHTSPALNRQAIEEQGLRPSEALGGMNACGVYLWSDLELHWQLIAEIISEEGFDSEERPFDLWQVDVSGLELERDRVRGPRTHGAFFSPEPIPAERLSLRRSYQTVAEYLGVRDLDELREELGLVCEDELAS
jgi:hypothetical protein